MTSPKHVGVVLFEGFELLDVCGPLEMLAQLPDRFALQILGPGAGAIMSGQGVAMWADHGYEDAPPCDILLVPGGMGTRALVKDEDFLAWLRAFASNVQYVTSVCTGSAVLAAAGLLEGYRATSNKRAFAWASSHGSSVQWVPEARWVEDRNRWTSSGIAAGMDMTLALIARLVSDEAAQEVSDHIEYDWHRDPSWDPFAAKNGLVPR